jgi:hypothetical protein
MIAARKWPATSSDNCARRSGRRVLGLVDIGAFTRAARAFRGLAVFDRACHAGIKAIV